MSTATMNLGTWEALADALRAELAEYGGLLVLLDAQRDAILNRRVDDLLQSNNEVEAQGALAARCRRTSEQQVLRLTAQMGVSANTTLRQLLPQMPPAGQPMFESLIEELTDMVEKTGAKAKRNRVLLARASEINEEILRRVRPKAMTKTYNARGGVSVHAGQGRGLDLSA